METLNVLYCPNCFKKFTEVYIFPCKHNFCDVCTNVMNNGVEIICLICSNSCHQDEIQKNNILEKVCSFSLENKKTQVNKICYFCKSDRSEKQAEKYCVDCSHYLCYKCLQEHVKSRSSYDHKIIDINKFKKIIKSPEPYCRKHNAKFTIYCKTCNSIICSKCFIADHKNHIKSDDLENVFANSYSNIKNKFIEIDNIIKTQKKLIKNNKVWENNLLNNCTKVRYKIEKNAKELKDQIDKLTMANIDRINIIENDFIKSVEANLKDIKDQIFSLTNLKSYIENAINKGSNIDVFNLENELNINIMTKSSTQNSIKKILLSFEKSSLDQKISTELSSSLFFLEIKDLQIMLKNWTSSACVYKQNIYSVNNKDECIDIYDIESGKYKNSIEYKKYLRNDISSMTFIFNTQDALYLYYSFNFNKHTCILKLINDNTTFAELKILEHNCKITFSFKKTLLVRTESNLLIELASNGDELDRISIPDEAILSSSNYFNTAQQLSNGHYIVTSTDNKSFKISLLNYKGDLIKSFKQPLINKYIRICTDGKKYIFVLEWNIGKITVMSTDLQHLYDFEYPKVQDICYDQVNDKFLLVKKKKLIYFTYNPVTF